MWRVTSSRNFKEDDDMLSLSNVRKQEKDRAPHLKVLRPMQKSFVKAMDYSTYRLKKNFQRYNSKIASKLAKLVKKPRSQLRKTDFDEMDPTSISVFLKEFRDACDSIGIQEGIAKRFVSYFMKKPVSSSLEARLSA